MSAIAIFREDIRCILDLRHARTLERACSTAMEINQTLPPSKPFTAMICPGQILFGQFDARRRVPRNPLNAGQYFTRLDALDHQLARAFRTNFSGEVPFLLQQLAASDPHHAVVAVFHFSSLALIFDQSKEQSHQAASPRQWRIGIAAFDGARSIAEEDQCLAATARSRAAGRELNFLCTEASSRRTSAQRGNQHDDQNGEDDEADDEIVTQGDEAGAGERAKAPSKPVISASAHKGVSID